jgi:hypothetical protein
MKLTETFNEAIYFKIKRLINVLYDNKIGFRYEDLGTTWSISISDNASEVEELTYEDTRIYINKTAVNNSEEELDKLENLISFFADKENNF